MATLIINRKAQYLGYLTGMRILIDDKSIGLFFSGQYKQIEIKGGNHEIECKSLFNTIKTEYYFNLSNNENREIEICYNLESWSFYILLISSIIICQSLKFIHFFSNFSNILNGASFVLGILFLVTTKRIIEIKDINMIAELEEKLKNIS